MKNEHYDEETLKDIIKESTSIAQVLRKMKLLSHGGNYKTFHKYKKLYDIDTSHFKGLGWNSGDVYKNFNVSKPLDDILVENSTYTNNTSLKKRLLDDNLLVYHCYDCGIQTWEGKYLSLHLDHINGINDDNRIENLRLLCPNCHSQTDTYCGRNIKKIEKKSEKSEKKKHYCSCGNEKTKRAKTCVPCYNLEKRRVKDRPTKEELILELESSNYSAMGRKYGVSDNTIRKWIK